MNNKVTYHQQVSYCGKPHCRKCQEGTGHGPYWYAYQTVNGRTTRTYVGKQLPPDVQASVQGLYEPPSTYTDDLEQGAIRIYVLGQFRLERRDGQQWQTVTDSAWQQQRVRSLLSCLISCPGRKLGREQVMDAVWPDLDIEAAASRIDRAVYSLRQVFEPERSRPATSSLLRTEREILALADQQQVWIDADAFEHLLTQAHASSDRGEVERLFEEAVTLYGGDFLPEERKIEWVIARRESLQRKWIGLLLELADLRIEREALANAIDPLDRLLSVDPTNEAAVQRLVSLLVQLGRRGEALRAYKRLATVLQQEYGIAPLPETRAIYDAVRLGGNTAPTRRPVETAAENVGAFSAGTRQDAPPTLQIGRSHQSPLVGREQEIELLQKLLLATEQATKFKLSGQKKASSLPLDTQRRPQSVLLMGEVGIGKTRLAEEIGREARKRGWAVAWSRIYPQEGSIPYRLWIEVMRRAMEQGAWQRQEMSKRPLIYQPLTALLPELDGLMPQIALPSSQPPEQEQLRMWEATRELLTVISEGTPLLIVLDDLQWADGSSCELLAYMARRLYSHSIIMIGTCRDNELGPNHPLRPLLTDLQREHAIESLSLQPLSNEQISALVSHMPHLAEPMVKQIQTRAAGNPFFAEELARTVEAASSVQFIAPNTTPNVPDQQGNHAIPPLPDTITAVLNLRLSRLSNACQRLLGKAAVLGGSFEFQVISAMEANVPGSSEDIVLDLLEEAMQSGMLTEEGTGTRITYQFWHPLLVSHLYEGLSAARRATFHRRAAEVLRQEYQGREEEGAATIVYHLVQGGASSQQISHYAELAGDRAYSLSAYPDAEQHYRLAVKHMQTGANTNANEQLHLAYLLERLGECTRIQGSSEEARHFYEQALSIRSRKDIFPLPIDEQQEAQVDALLWCEIGWTWYDVGGNAQALQCYAQGEQVLQKAGLTAGPAWAKIRLQQSYASWREGNYKEARRVAQKALELFEEVLEQQKYSVERASRSTVIRRTIAGDPVDLGRIHSLLGLAANGAGQATEAIAHWNTALALYEQYDRQREISIVCCNLGDVHLRKAEHSLAQAFLRRSLSIAERIGDIPSLGIVLSNMGVLASRSGALAEAEALFKRSLVLAEQINDPVCLSLWSTALANVFQDQGKLSEAGACLAKALSIGREMNIAPCIGYALVILGNMRITQAIAVDVEGKDMIMRFLRRARNTLQRALALEGIEAETKTEGQLTLAQTELLLDEVEAAQQLAVRTLEEAHRFELTWLIARAQRLMGSISAAQGRQEQADRNFEQALHTFRKSGMRLEYARTLQQHGIVLAQRGDVEGQGSREQQRELEYLREARQLFTECKAALDVQMAERVLARYEQVTEK